MNLAFFLFGVVVVALGLWKAIAWTVVFWVIGALVVAYVARRLYDYAADAQGALEDRFRILGSGPAGERDTLVRSKVFPTNGQPLALDWRLRAGDSGPVIIDLIVEGASLLVSQRSEFAAVIERHDLDGLLAELRARAGPSSS